MSYDIVNKNNNSIIENNLKSSSCYTNTLVNNDEEEEEDTYYNDNYNQNKDNDIRIIWNKLKQLQHNLHVNNISDKKSACFWCTYDFDNPPIYIPKHFIKESYHVYGCFCSPECATAYLMEENIDSSSKFERYFLINHIYSKIYDYKKSIKPAPSPQYMLEKFYGNLSIQEYRALLRNERLFLIVDKPLTRILPELHEDNDDFIINNKILPSNNNSMWNQVNPSGEGTLKDRNFLQSGYHIGINTVGQTLRNANLQLRSEPPCPQVKVSPWMTSTIEPDVSRRPFEISGC